MYVKIANKDKLIPEVISDYKTGDSAEELGRRYGINGKTVRTWLKKYHVKVRSRSEAVKIKKKRLKPVIIDLVNKGFSAQEVATMVGCSRGTVYKTAIPKKTKSYLFILNLYDSGASLSQLYKAFGPTPNTISKHLRQSGVTVRPVGGRNHTKYKGKKIPCAICHKVATRTSIRTIKPVCDKCYEKEYNQFIRRKKISEYEYGCSV
jgi:transposase